jgi:hypothetical protein
LNFHNLGHSKTCTTGKPSTDGTAAKGSAFVSAIAYPPAIDRNHSNGVYDTLQAIAFNVNLAKHTISTANCGELTLFMNK